MTLDCWILKNRTSNRILRNMRLHRTKKQDEAVVYILSFSQLAVSHMMAFYRV